MIAAADSSTALMATRASSAVTMPRSASVSAAPAASAAASAACSARATAAATSPAASPASMTSRACCSVDGGDAVDGVGDLLAGALGLDRGGGDLAARSWEISSAVDWIVSTSVATWPMPVRRIAAAPSAAPLLDGQVAALQRVGQRGELGALDGVVDAQLRGGERLGLQRARQDDQHGGLEDDEDRVQQHHAEAEVAGGHDVDAGAGVLQDHEAEVVDRDRRRRRSRSRASRGRRAGTPATPKKWKCISIRPCDWLTNSAE